MDNAILIIFEKRIRNHPVRPSLEPRQALNPAFLKIKPQRQEIENIPIDGKKIIKQNPNAEIRVLEAEINCMSFMTLRRRRLLR